MESEVTAMPKIELLEFDPRKVKMFWEDPAVGANFTVHGLETHFNAYVSALDFHTLLDLYVDALSELSELRKASEWVSVEDRLPSASTWVMAWLHLPLNPTASGHVMAQFCGCRFDEPESYGNMRMTVGCWWANRRYYAAGHITHWQPLPPQPLPASAVEEKKA